jgi:hypothetical protein
LHQVAGRPFSIVFVKGPDGGWGDCLLIQYTILTNAEGGVIKSASSFFDLKILEIY